MPDKYGVNGTVSSTKPLNYGGSLIDNFTLTFKDGAVVDFEAEQGEDVLKHLLESDDGAKRLGEVALVPHESPIRSEEHTSELQSRGHIVCRLLLEKKKNVFVVYGGKTFSMRS